MNTETNKDCTGNLDPSDFSKPQHQSEVSALPAVSADKASEDLHRLIVEWVVPQLIEVFVSERCRTGAKSEERESGIGE